MKFRNVTDDELFVPSLGAHIAAGDTTDDLPDDVADGFVGQVDKWVAVGRDAKAHQQEVVAVQAEPSEQEK